MPMGGEREPRLASAVTPPFIAMAVKKRPVILLGWRAEPFRRRSAHARSGTSHIAQDQSTDSRTRDR